MKLINSKFLINENTFEPELEMTIVLSYERLFEATTMLSSTDECEKVLGKSLLNLINSRKNRDRNEEADD